MRKIHRLEILEEAIEERAKPQLGYRVEIGKGLYAAKIDRAELGVIVKRPGEIAPLNSESVYHRLMALLGLSPDLQREINQGRDSNNDSSQLPDRRQHFPIHMLLQSRFARLDTERFFDRRRIVHFPAFDYCGDLVDIPDVLRRVSVHEAHVSQLSRSNDAAIFVHTHYQ